MERLHQEVQRTLWQRWGTKVDPEGRRAEADLEVIRGVIEAQWKTVHPGFRLLSRGLRPLESEGQNDTIQTVHFLFAGDQAFKILYPHRTVGKLLADCPRP